MLIRKILYNVVREQLASVMVLTEWSNFLAIVEINVSFSTNWDENKNTDPALRLKYVENKPARVCCLNAVVNMLMLASYMCSIIINISQHYREGILPKTTFSITSFMAFS